MRKFNFNLEALLKLKRHREMQAQINFAEVQKHKVLLEQEIAHAHQKIREYAYDRDHPSSDQNAFDLSQMHHFMAAEFRTIFRNEDALKNLQPQVDTKRRELIEANQATSMLEKLKEKKAGEHFEEQKQKELATMDETATLMFNLQQNQRNRKPS